MWPAEVEALCLRVPSGPLSLRGLILTVLVGVAATSLGKCLSPSPVHFHLCFESAVSVGDTSPGSEHNAFFPFSHGVS